MSGCQLLRCDSWLKGPALLWCSPLVTLGNAKALRSDSLALSWHEFTGCFLSCCSVIGLRTVQSQLLSTPRLHVTDWQQTLQDSPVLPRDAELPVTVDELWCSLSQWLYGISVKESNWSKVSETHLKCLPVMPTLSCSILSLFSAKN